MIVKVRHTFSVSGDTIWAIVSDPTQDSHWVDTTPSVKNIAGKIGAVGSMYQFKQIVRGKAMEGTIQITKNSDWNMEFRVEDPFRVSTISYHLQETKKGCKLTQISQPRWKRNVGPSLIVKFMVKKQLKHQMRLLASYAASKGSSSS